MERRWLDGRTSVMRYLRVERLGWRPAINGRDPVEVVLLRDALEGLGAAVLEPESGSGDQVPEGA
jgi:hypothetical protein